MSATGIVRAVKTTVLTIEGRPYLPFTGEKDKRPATAVEAVVGNRVQWLVPHAFPAHNAETAAAK